MRFNLFSMRPFIRVVPAFLLAPLRWFSLALLCFALQACSGLSNKAATAKPEPAKSEQVGANANGQATPKATTTAIAEAKLASQSTHKVASKPDNADKKNTAVATAVSFTPDAGTQKLIAQAELAIRRSPEASEAQRILNEATAAYNSGDNVIARRLARVAAEQAEVSGNRYYLALAKEQLEKVRGYTNLNAKQYSQLRAAENAMVNNEGLPAYRLLRQLRKELRVAPPTA